MSKKYTVFAKNYGHWDWGVTLYTDSLFKALKVWIKSLSKYEHVEFIVRKR